MNNTPSISTADADNLPELAATRLVEREVRGDSGAILDSDWVIAELPVAISANGITQAVMMATPNALEDFGLGFALTEGIVERCRDVLDIEISVTPDESGEVGSVEVQLTIPNNHFQRLKERRRTLAGPSGCGLCGYDAIANAIRPLPVREPVALPKKEAIDRAVVALEQGQPLAGKTAAAHAAAWFSPDGNLVAVREDVGRHNALDKLIGWHAVNQQPGFVVVSSRASYELVSKAVTANLGVLVAVSAPTAQAITAAANSGLRLIAFSSEGRHVIYC